MGKYRKVDVRLWGDRKFRALTDDARWLWIYFLTCDPNTVVPGVIKGVPVEVIVGDLRYPNAGKLKTVFAELRDAGMAFADWDNRLIWLPKGPEYNPASNRNMGVGWLRMIDDLPECALTDKIREGIRAHLAGNDSAKDALKVDPKQLRNRYAKGSETVSKPEAVAVAGSGTEGEPFQPGPVDRPPTREEIEEQERVALVRSLLDRAHGVNRG